ncbi:hypothetical protein [Natronorubrum thiooxidans]|uniref:hypothetical protein n=1 Tax=Natronorubrum thiooxidans TaxID=308853 RepID=UPI00117D5061|nr:hypothetical protein [Natronorubrum thiooxidans]
MISVSKSDIEPTEYPERVRIVSTESAVLDDSNYTYTLETKVVFDGPYGRLAVLSYFRGLPIDDREDIQASVHDRYFIYDDGTQEIAEVAHSMRPPENALEDIESFQTYCEGIATNDPPAVYDLAVDECDSWRITDSDE